MKNQATLIENFQKLLANEKFRIIIISVCLLFAVSKILLNNYTGDYRGINEISTLKSLQGKISLLKTTQTISNNQELTNLRRQVLNELDLSKDSYKLSPAIFEAIDYKCAWKEESGFYKQGLALYNPLILIFPFIYTKEPQSYISKSQALAEATDTLFYNAHSNQLELTIDVPKSLKVAINNKEVVSFLPISFNAADLGYNSIQLNLENTSGIESPIDNKIYHNVTKLGCLTDENGENGVNSVINNNAISNLHFTKLPASAVFDLWTQTPTNLEKPAPAADLKYKINFN